MKRTLGLSIVALAVLGLAVLFADDLGRRAQVMDLGSRLAPPSLTAWLGTDQLGRDVLARTLAGAPWSLGVAGCATTVSLLLGVLLGLAAAELRGPVRTTILQVVNLTLSFPGLVAALAAVSILGQSAGAVIIVLSALSWPLFTRVVYAQSLSIRTRDYVTAARLAGVGRATVLWRHVAPSLRSSLLAMTAFHFADMLVAASALTFLGVGAPLGSAAWGVMLSESRAYLYDAPWML
ncbi:MAG: ABC transporter permease, partial [Phenylobacterium sp.]|nr:ABC transporter permease [Phenylobacterium sp.]